MPACSVEMATLDPTHPVPIMPMRMPADTGRVYRASVDSGLATGD